MNERFWVVTRPGLDSTLADFVFETDVEGLALIAVGAAGARPGSGARPWAGARAYATRVEALTAAADLAFEIGESYRELAEESAIEAARLYGPADPRPEGLVGEAWDIEMEMRAGGPAGR